MAVAVAVAVVAVRPHYPLQYRIRSTTTVNMAVSGQPFQLDLSPGGTSEAQGGQEGSWSGAVRDVSEQFPSSAPEPPRAPSARTSRGTGFPAHRSRMQRSMFQRQQGIATQQEKQKEPQPDDGTTRNAKMVHDQFDVVQRQRIDEENRQRLAAMSAEEILREQQELLRTLSPGLVERLRRRWVIPTTESPISTRLELDQTTSATERVVGSTTAEFKPKVSSAPRPAAFDPDDEPLVPPVDLVPASTKQLPPLPRIHFPTRPEAPILDPSSPDFLQALHDKYYPDLSPDPSKLAWMAPIPTYAETPSSLSSSYSPYLSSLPASAIRFDFRGDVLAPRTARDISPAIGLHHHAEAPEAAGYTIPELARLARSAFPAQRCIAYQTLGRILYRLGSGRFGPEESELVMGLWRCVEDGVVLETLQQEAGGYFGVGRGSGTNGVDGNGSDSNAHSSTLVGGGGGVIGGHHASAKALAVEALWNWQRGGGKRWKAQDN